MKVTALIPDQIVKEVKHFAKGRTLTDSLVVALQEWISLKKIHELNSSIKQSPLNFSDGFSALKVRSLNRK